jgi:hypothetical protein
VLAALPFLAAGIALALAIKSYVHSVGRVYAADLAGAAVGALAIVPLLRAGAAPTLLVSLGVVAGVAGFTAAISVLEPGTIRFATRQAARALGREPTAAGAR